MSERFRGANGISVRGRTVSLAPEKTAIVPFDEGYVKWHCLEGSRPMFVHVMTFLPGQTEQLVPEEVFTLCSPESLFVLASQPKENVSVGASVSEGWVILSLDRPCEVVVCLAGYGIKSSLAFASATKEEYLANQTFYKLARDVNAKQWIRFLQWTASKINKFCEKLGLFKR